MATRPLTKFFKDLRDKARAAEPDDHIVPLDASSENKLNGETEMEETQKWKSASRAAPEWLGRLKPITEAMAYIKNKMAELKKLHQGMLTASFDRKADEHQVEILTSRITSLFQKCKTDVKHLGAGLELNPDEIRMKENLQSLVAQRLADLSNKFRKQQSDYLEKLRDFAQKRAGRVQIKDTNHSDDEEEASFVQDEGMTSDQQQMTAAARKQIQQTEREIRQIAKSVHELAVIFQDLAQLVHEQGSILDQIDYNISKAKEHMTEAKKEVTQAATSQNSARNKYCIILLVLIIFGAIISLILYYRG